MKHMCACGEEAVIHGMCDECFTRRYEDKDYAEHLKVKIKKMARKAERSRGGK